MIIRPDIVKRANTVLKGWEDASDFTKTFVLINWSTEMGGISKAELAVTLYPDEIFPSGAPRQRALNKVWSIIHRIRHHPVSDGMVIFTIQRPVNVNKPGIGVVTQYEWFVINIEKKEDWEWVKQRLEKMVTGFRGCIRKFNGEMQIAIPVRRQKVAKTLQELAEEINTLEKIPNGTAKKKKKKTT